MKKRQGNYAGDVQKMMPLTGPRDNASALVEWSSQACGRLDSLARTGIVDLTIEVLVPSNKFEALREEGTLNPRPEAVADPRFEEDGFFDPRDVVQVKYEMLRRVRVEELPITRAAAEAGCSRQTFYDARANFERAGIAGLVPKKRGPRGRHKLRGEVLEFLQTAVSPGQPIHAAELVVQVEQRFGVHVHPRSIERALRDTKKNLG